MAVTVTKTDKTQKGKDRVYFDNRHGWTDAYYVGQKCPIPAVGQLIDPMTSSKDFDGNGKLTWFLNDWKPVTHPIEDKDGISVDPALAKKYPEVGDVRRYGAVVTERPKGWAIDYGDLSRFVSNIVGSAIAANLIKQPSDLAPWIAYSYRALEAVREGKPIDFDDPVSKIVIPEEEAPDPTEPQGYEEGDPGIQSDEDIPW